MWNPDTCRYTLIDAIPGWQMIETRDCVIIDTEGHGLVAVQPIGMSQICSCNWEADLAVGARVEKGDPMGYFMFGGSDIVMVFQDGVDVDFLCEAEGDGFAHMFMSEPYASLIPRSSENTVPSHETLPDLDLAARWIFNLREKRQPGLIPGCRSLLRVAKPHRPEHTPPRYSHTLQWHLPTVA